MNMAALERAVLAEQVRVNEQYLYQCLTGRRAMDPKEAARIERETAGRIRRWHLRRADWHEIWPELIGTDGAPTPPKAEPAHAS